jgi:hypothetical protein
MRRRRAEYDRIRKANPDMLPGKAWLLAVDRVG